MFKVTGKKNGVKTTKTLTATVTVKPVTITAASEGENLTVGSKVSDLFTVKPSGKKLTYTSSNPEVATVDEDGTVTAVAAGEATITASSKYAEESASVTVNVKAAVLESVTQASTTTLAAVFSGDTSAISASDITITNTSTNANYAVKSVAVDSDDSSIVTITTYVAMADGCDYTVTYDDVTLTFTATDGTIATLSVTPTEVTVATETTIYALLSDANGVLLNTIEYNDTTTDTNLDFEITVENGYTSGSDLYLNETGDTAVANLTYHSGSYDDDGNEVGNIESGDITITAVDAATVTASGWAVKYSTTASSSYSDVTETKVAAGDTAYAYIQLTLSDDSTSTDVSAYTFESSNDDVMTVAGTDLSSGYLTISAYSAGSAYIIVKDSSTGSAVTTLALTVRAARAATTLSLSSTSMTLSTDSAVADTATVTASVYDQYGESFALTTDLAITNLTDSSVTITSNASLSNDITVDVTSLAESISAGSSATYTIKVTAEDSLSKTFTVTAKTPSDTISSYGMVLSATSVDAIITSSLTSDTTVTATIYGYDSNGVKTSVVTGATFALTLGSTSVTTDAAGTAVTGGAIAVNDIDAGAQMSTGTYKLTATFDVDGTTKTLTKSFVVTNSQPTATASVDAVTLSTGGSLNDIITITYDGTTYSSSDSVITNYNSLEEATATISSSGKVYVSTITVTIPLGDNKVVQTISIGKTITVS